MKRAFTASSLILLVLLPFAACRSARDTDTPETQIGFGVRMARMNLWREAMFRFQRAVELDPQAAMAHNNLAVAYEANGEFEKAAEEYKLAMRLDKSNQYIQKNYSRLVEFQQRNKKRQQQQQARSAAATQTAAPAAAPVTATAEPPAAPPAATATAPGGAR